jgi:hypothetical protein
MDQHVFARQRFNVVVVLFICIYDRRRELRCLHCYQPAFRSVSCSGTPTWRLAVAPAANNKTQDTVVCTGGSPRAMGLPSGPHGVKTFSKAKFPHSLGEFASLKAARVQSRHTPAQTVVVLDGNVFTKIVPSAASTYSAYMSVFVRFVRAAFEAGDVVVVVFDEPAILTRAKVEEQRRRDAASRRSNPVLSEDVQATTSPVNDSYGRHELENCNPHETLKHRQARGRFHDALCIDVLRLFEMEFDQSERSSRVLVFDGVDCRGINRDPGDIRRPTLVSNNSLVRQSLSRGPDDPPVGEGDLKITDTCSNIQYLRNTGELFVSIEVAIVCTTDTDSIAIELLHHAACAVHHKRNSNDRPLKTLLCFREPPSRKRDADDNRSESANYACFDVELLYYGIRDSLFKRSLHGFSPRDALHAVALLCVGWALCGCDFVRLKGMRSDVVFDAVEGICEDPGHCLERMAPVMELRRASPHSEVLAARRGMAESVLELIDSCVTRLASMPRLKRASASASEKEHWHVLRGVWCVLYWSGLEFTDIESWGFQSTVAAPIAGHLSVSPI